MLPPIVRATKVRSKARICLAGPAGSGKTYSALAMAGVFGKNIIVIDSENNSSAEYADEFPFEFDVQPIEDKFSPGVYISAIEKAENLGYDVIIADSLSHAWFGPDGELEMANRASKRYSGNTWAGWNDVTPEHNKFLHKIVHCKTHFIGTMRSKVDTVMDRDENGKAVVRKLGLKPIQKEGMDFEFNVYGDISIEHDWTITKTRCPSLDGMIIRKPGREVAEIILSWLNKGEDPAVVAEKRFFLKYSKINSWQDIQGFVGNIPKPSTVEEWEMVDVLMSGYL